MHGSEDWAPRMVVRAFLAKNTPTYRGMSRPYTGVVTRRFRFRWAACAWPHLLVKVQPEAVPPGQAGQRVLPQGHTTWSGKRCCQQDCLPCRFAAGLDKALTSEQAA